MRRLLNWFRQADLEDGLDRELSYHFDRRVEDLKKSGLTEPAAKRQAHLELGATPRIREEVRDAWLTLWLREFVHDLRFSARAFRRSPSFTATAVLSLALGIGATTAIYSLVDQVLLRVLPVHEPDRLVLVEWKGEQLAPGRGSAGIVSYPICRDLQAQSQVFEGAFCRHPTDIHLSIGGEPRPVAAEIVSGSYFSVLGVRPALGRLLTRDDDWTPSAHPVVVLSYDLWQNQLAGSHDVVGRKVLVNNHPMTVVGVAAAAFRGVDLGEVPSIWIPAAMTAQATPDWDELWNRRARWMHVFARLKPGVSLERAQAGLQPWFKNMLTEDTRRAGFPQVTAEQRERFLASSLALTPAPQGRSDLRTTLEKPLWVLFTATAVLMALACLNVAGLFLARGSARTREVTTRMALGASRARIGRQLLADSLLIALAGGCLGVLLAPLLAQSLISFLPNDESALDLNAAIDSRVLLCAFLVSAAAGLLSGLAPALQAGRGSLIASLRERSGYTGGVRLRKILVTAQIAFTLVLVIGAALFVQTLAGLMTKGPGFSTSSLISFNLDARRNGYSEWDGTRLVRRLHTDLAALPMVESAAFCGAKLLEGGSWNSNLTIQSPERRTTDRAVLLNSISTDFFTTLGVRLIAGRNFGERDVRPLGEQDTRTVIVNETFARKYFGTASPLGVRLGAGSGPGVQTDIEIVGVVANFSYRGLREEREQAFFPILSSASPGANFYLKVKGTPDAAFQAIRTAVRQADPALPLSDFRTFDEQVNRSLMIERLLATLSGGFGTLALLLSLVGLYGVMSFVVTQRTREIGVRLALGATRGSAIWLVLRDALTMILGGTAIALPFAWGLGRFVESQLFAVKPTDPVTIAAATLLLTLAALGAALVPAYRASTVAPTEALRFE